MGWRVVFKPNVMLVPVRDKSHKDNRGIYVRHDGKHVRIPLDWVMRSSLKPPELIITNLKLDSEPDQVRLYTRKESVILAHDVLSEVTNTVSGTRVWPVDHKPKPGRGFQFL